MKALVKNFIIFAVGLITSVLLILFGIKPILSDLAVVHDDIKQQKTELLTLDQQILAFKTAQSDLSRAERKDELKSAIPTRETLVDAVRDLEAAMTNSASIHELRITDPKLEDQRKPRPQVVAGHPGVEEIPYTLSITNNYTGVLNALAYLEHLPHFTEISKIVLSAETVPGAGGEAINTGDVLGNIQGVFFVQQAEEPAPANQSTPTEIP